MCILLVTTAHPEYSLILLSNRDEFLHRPTARAAFWEEPNSHILSGRDLARPERGTWLGITRTGRLAVLTNYREPTSLAALAEKSRGAMVTSFLTSTTTDSSTSEWLHSLHATGDLHGVGGFSLLCGILRPKDIALGTLQPLAVISNRTPAGDDGVENGATWIAGEKGETWGLSNSLFGDPWPKVKRGEGILAEVVDTAVKEGKNEEELLESLFGVLSFDTLPKLSRDMDAHPADMTPITDEDLAKANIQTQWWRDRKYGTQTQTIILVGQDGRVKYVERTLFDDQVRPLKKEERDVVTEFMIEGWNE
ncbi:uncharacterized protein LAJ45_02015 [Morchella importuna]|uniref:uncharacterized protein n=1 Tax=Morchella importuna TaxID=1174673 RepID=UPI001E8CC7D6|nr:uncharacterized protein LAJ45_02015 [Morchella importuna]KAH8154247.1 hypothetical protein LAJ45_02015 [Morchella importuna]